jgi:hypothetical protein
MESLKDIISDIRVFLYGGVLTLPLTIAGTLSILGLFTANYAILFFLVGFLIITPITSTILNFIIEAIFGGKSFNPFMAKSSDICKLVIPYSTLKNPVGSQDTMVASSSWMAMISFFIGYIFTNAIQLYNRDTTDTTITVTSSDSSDINSMVTNRKSQAVVAMISIVIFTLIVFGFRYYTGCESLLGMILTSLTFIFLGNGWYKALSSVGQDRLSDLFGIANRLLSPSAINNAPIACVPVPAQ